MSNTHITSREKRSSPWDRRLVLTLLGVAIVLAVTVSRHLIRSDPSAGPPLATDVGSDALVEEDVVSKPPHVVFVLVDDIGFNDIGWISPELETPNIDRIASEGIRIDSYYTNHVCTPTRGAFLTGRYAGRIGLGHCFIRRPEPFGLNLDETTLAEKLRETGYTTYLVGKWHLGFYNWASTPTKRGFDYFYGYYSGDTGYYDHAGIGFVDLHDQEEPVLDQNGTYSTVLFQDKAEEYIAEHAKTRPDSSMFLFYAMQNVHSPMEIPPGWYADSPACKSLVNPTRAAYCSMLLIADDAIGNLTIALDKAFPDDDVLLVISGDNGGFPTSGGNNMPLRGAKGNLWEGGTRNFAVVHSKTLIPESRRGTLYDKGFMHVTDWHATIAELGNVDVSADELDGMDMWSALVNDEPSPRKEFLYNMDPGPAGINDMDNEDFRWSGAYRWQNWKLLVNVTDDDWHPLPTTADYIDDQKCLDPAMLECDCLTGDSVTGLYDLDKDPTEITDLKAQYPDIVKLITKKMQVFAEEFERPCNIQPFLCPMESAAAAAAAVNGYWGPWH